MKQSIKKRVRESLEKQSGYQNASSSEKEHFVLLLAESIEKKYEIKNEEQLSSLLADIDKEVKNVFQ